MMMMSMNALYYVAATMPLGDSTVTSNTVLFVPQWDDLDNAPNDVVCFVGSAMGLESELKSVNGGGGLNCSAKNGCGVHIHSGSSCADSAAQGGHWYNADDLDLDPWAIVGYDQTDSVGHGQFASCVYTGFDVASDPDQLVGHAFVVHADDGSRVSCGVIGKADVDYEPTTFTADTIPIPGIEVSSTGTVSVLTNFQDVTDGVCYIGMAMGLEPDIESFLLETGSEECDAANGCGAHIHSGTGCQDKEAQGGHYYDGDNVAEDPWALESYYKTDSAGSAALIGCVITGNGASDYESRPFVIHKADGSRLLCGVLEGDDDSGETSPTESPVASPVEMPSFDAPVQAPVPPPTSGSATQSIAMAMASISMLVASLLL